MRSNKIAVISTAALHKGMFNFLIQLEPIDENAQLALDSNRLYKPTNELSDILRLYKKSFKCLLSLTV